MNFTKKNVVSYFVVLAMLFIAVPIQQPALAIEKGVPDTIAVDLNLGADALPNQVHPPIFDPIPDIVKQEVPEVLGNREFAALGYVDITQEPFKADPSGKRDSTKEIQSAIDFARDNQMICFFPSGDYLVSDTLIMRQAVFARSHMNAIIAAKYMPCVVEGSTVGKKPRIILSPSSEGFNNTSSPKDIIVFWTYTITRDAPDQKNFTINTKKSAFNDMMNMQFKGVDIVIGEDNPGAIAIHASSAEGSSIQDVYIDASNGHAGMAGAAGNGGSWANVTVEGGEYGLKLNEITVPGPIMEGITLINQTKSAIITGGRGAHTMTGLKIISKTSGPLISQQRLFDIIDGSISLIDAHIEFPDSASGAVFNTPVRNLYLKNVYVKNGERIYFGGETLNPNGWARINEFALGVTAQQGEHVFSAPIYVDGEKTERLSDIELDISPPDDIISKHLWDENFPNFENINAANVKAAPYYAKGDSITDDTAALQRAIDENEIVFLPKGYYRVTDTLRLKPNTKLIGAAAHLSVILVRDPEGHFGDSQNPQPIIETADTDQAETIIAFLYIAIPRELTNSTDDPVIPVYALKWQSGGNSMVRTIIVDPLSIYGFIGSSNHYRGNFKFPIVYVTGNGGGRWYNFHLSLGWTPREDDLQMVKIEGTQQPLRFYSFEPQHGVKSGIVAKISDSKNVTFYGTKSEGDSIFMSIENSDNIAVYGYSGIGTGPLGGPLFEVSGTDNFTITNISDQANRGNAVDYGGGEYTRHNYMDYYVLEDKFENNEKLIVEHAERPVVYKRGNYTQLDISESNVKIEDDTIKVTVTGKPVRFDVKPVLINERVMVPMRAIFEALGATVEWDGEKGVVSGTKGNSRITLIIGSSIAYINEMEVTLDEPAGLIEGRTMVPLRFVSEAFGNTVNWNEKIRTAEID